MAKIFGSYQISGGFRRFDDPRDRRICWKEPNVTNHKISLKSHAQNSIYFWFDILTLNLIKSERLADYSTIESRIMAFRGKLILTKTHDFDLWKIAVFDLKNVPSKVCHELGVRWTTSRGGYVTDANIVYWVRTMSPTCAGQYPAEIFIKIKIKNW